MNERLQKLKDNIPEHIRRSVDLYSEFKIKVSELKSKATEEQKLAIDKLMSLDNFCLDFTAIAKLESILGVHLIEIL
jgi:hypothetical protein